MAALIILTLIIYGIFRFNESCKKENARMRAHDEIMRILYGGEVKQKEKPKYRMKEVSPESDELFMTDLGDFDEAFKL